MVFLMLVEGQEGCGDFVSLCSPPALQPRRTEESEGERRKIEKFNIISDTKVWG
jgi:hypothetical protein